MPLEHQIIKTTRGLLAARITKPLTEAQIPQGFPKDPSGIAEYLIRSYLRLSGFNFGEGPLGASTSFTIYRPDRSRTTVFDKRLSCDGRVATMLHVLGHIHSASLLRIPTLSPGDTLVWFEPRDRVKIAPEASLIEEAADKWGMSFAEQLLTKAHPNNLLAEGLKAGSQRIAFLGRV